MKNNNARSLERSGRGRVAVALLAAVLTIISGLVFASPAAAASATVTLTPATSTVESNVNVTYTVSIVCSGPGLCENTIVSFASDTVTGNGAHGDMSSWFGASSCGFVTRTVSPGLISYDYGTLNTGNIQCTFNVRAPEYLTLGGAVATITPTISGSNIPTVVGASSTINLIAGHNASIALSAPVNALPGAQSVFTVRFICGTNAEYTGDIGTNAIRIEVPLPANFAYASYATSNSVPGSVTITQPSVGSTGGSFVYEDATGATCGNPPLNINNAMSIGVRGTIVGAPGTQSCVTASATWTYIDGVPGSGTSQSGCTTVIDIQTLIAKAGTSTSLGNVGQFTFGSGSAYPYTHPGNWDQSGAPLSFVLTARTTPATNPAGVSYHLQDPLPCLDNLVGGVYLPRAIGDVCQNPAFVPTFISAAGFTPSSADQVVLHYTDGSSANIPFASGGWQIPAVTPGNGVAEIEIPPFASEGANTAAVAFTVLGWASEAAQPGAVLRNTVSSTPYISGATDPLRTPQLSTVNVGIVDLNDGPGEDGSTVLYPSLTTAYNGVGTCQASVSLSSNSLGSQRNFIELTNAPSEAIYLDYLAPVGASVTNGTTKTFTLTFVPDVTRIFTAAGVVPTVTPDFNGTGRTLYSWMIPAGVITTPGVYRITMPAMTVNLGAGCAGVYNSDMTLGYGTPVESCVFNPNSSPFAQDPPMLPNLNQDLDTNGSPIEGNFCGYSNRLNIAAINPAYTVDKLVQGNLDAGPAPEGTNGRVSPEGGTATYTVSFENTGQSNLDDPVLYDLLPAIGDTIASGTTPRNSAFGVVLTALDPLPAGVSVEYSTAVNPCRPELLPVNPGCVDDWSTTPPSSLAATTALRFDYDGTVYAAAAPGVHGFEVEYTVSTPATTSGAIAWNSVGSNVTAGATLMGAAESTLVGLEAAVDQPQIVKSASTDTYSAVGDVVVYTFELTNNTAVTLTGVGVTDVLTDAAPGSIAPTATCVERTNPASVCSGASTTLAPDQSATFTATHTVTQADLDHGVISDQGRSAGTPPTGGVLNGTSDVVTVTAEQAPSLSLDKSVSPTVVTEAGQDVTYSFLVTNTGNVTLESIDITELTFTGTGTAPVINCPAVALAPEDDVTCTAAYRVTQDDIDAGAVSNTAEATADFGGEEVTSESSSADLDVTQSASLSLLKSASPDQVAAAGQTITYSFLVTNTGNVTIDAIAIAETEFSGTNELSAITCPVMTLAPESFTTCSATYVVSQDDIDAGAIVNEASADGTDPGGEALPVPPSSGVTVDVEFAPSLSLLKTADVETVDAVGDEITYSFLVTNNGNVTMDDIEVTDSEFSGSGELSAIECPETGLAPTEDMTCTATYAVTQADLDAGSIENSASVNGVDPDGDALPEPGTSGTVVDVDVNAALTLLKGTDVTEVDAAGDEVVYEFLVTNTGNVTIDGIVIEELEFTGTGDLTAITCPADELAPADDVTCTATYTVTQEDIDTGDLENTARAAGTSPLGDPLPEPPTSSVTVDVLQLPSLTLVKSADVDTVVKPGDVIGYDFLVTNTGNVTLTGLEIEELEFSGTGVLSAVGCEDTGLAPGNEVTCTAEYTVVASDAALESIENTAVATALVASGEEPVEVISSEESAAAVAVEFPPPGGMANTGAQFAFPAIGIGAGIALLGGLLFLISRRRKADV